MTPFNVTTVKGLSATAKTIFVIAEHYGITEREARDWLNEHNGRSTFYINDIYQVQVQPYGPEDKCLHLCIRRRDGDNIKDWRHFQQIKNELAGPEREAIEVYPAESRLVDTSNKWHLWVLPEGERMEVGWTKRDVRYATEYNDIPGLRQRPLEEKP